MVEIWAFIYQLLTKWQRTCVPMFSNTNLFFHILEIWFSILVFKCLPNNGALAFQGFANYKGSFSNNWIVNLCCVTQISNIYNDYKWSFHMYHLITQVLHEGTTMNLLYIQYLLRQGGTKVTSTFHTQLLMQTLP